MIKKTHIVEYVMELRSTGLTTDEAIAKAATYYLIPEHVVRQCIEEMETA